MEYYINRTDNQYKYVVVKNGTYTAYNNKYKLQSKLIYGGSKMIASGYNLIEDEAELAKLVLNLQ